MKACKCGKPAAVRFDRAPGQPTYCWDCCPAQDALIVLGWIPDRSAA